MPVAAESPGENRWCNGSQNNMGDIVISGMSLRVPQSDNTDEFAKNLLEHVDMVNEDETRWPKGLYGLPSRTGKIKDLSKFDTTFFGIHPILADSMDPQLRLILECTYEAIMDAGVNPEEVRGSKTGVFVGVSSSDTEDYFMAKPERVNGYGILGCAKAMFSNRISYTFDFNGPSFSVDSACSSSLVALHQAVQNIKTGSCDAAIVAGCNVLLKPTMSLQFLKLNMLSPEGKSKAFDAGRSGYVRSETVSVLYLQKSSVARRVYATVLGVKSNTDGAKELGITFPSGEMQKKLLLEIYKEIGFNPVDVDYIEAHGTGTKAGDPQELNTIAEVFCKGRSAPLPIGAVKTNMGHSEPASGLNSLAKVLIAMECKVIPANLHFTSPNPDIPALFDGRLEVVNKNRPWNGGYVGVNSFGFGGANAHVLLKSNAKLKSKTVSSDLPKLVMLSGRTPQAVQHFINKVEEHKDDDDFLNLIRQIHKTDTPRHMQRGYAILGDLTKREIMQQTGEKRQVWYVFSGMGCQWPGMGRDLMRLKPFHDSIIKSAAALAPYGIDLLYLINKGKKEDFEYIVHNFVSIAAIQVALVDVLRFVGVEPDGMLGHSVGELGCAYADRTMTAEQMVLSSYFRGMCVVQTNLPPGTMAAIGLSGEEAKKRCPEGVYVSCINAADSVTLSGPPEPVEELLSQLRAEGIFVKKVSSNNIAFHSTYISEAGVKLRASLDKLLPEPKLRSPKWISTSVPKSKWDTPLAASSSSEYLVNNLLSQVDFYSALQYIPEEALVIEIAPHALFQAILKRSVPESCVYVPLARRDTGLDFFLGSIGRIYGGGLNPDIQKLYPPVEFPVKCGTPTISSMIEWDHSATWAVADFVEQFTRSVAGECLIEIDLNKEDDKYLAGHNIDGRILFPATGYLYLMWKTLAKLNQKLLEEFPIVFEDVQFKRATILPIDNTVKFLVNILDGTGEFELCESGTPVCSGRARMVTDEKQMDLGAIKTPESNGHLPLNSSHIYQDLRLRGYDYHGLFRGIKQSDNFGIVGELMWMDNWVSFMDTVLQFSLLNKDTRNLNLPTRIQRVIMDPVKHMAAVKLLKEGQGLQICNDRDIGVVQSGGFEVAGLTATSVPRRQASHSQPKLQQFSFVPYFSDKDIGVESALMMQLLTVYENWNGTSLLKLVEMCHNVQPGMMLTPIAQAILENEPELEVDMTVLTDDVLSFKPVTEPIEVKVDTKDIRSKALSSKIHCIMTAVAVTHVPTLENIKASLLPGGFLLVQSTSELPQSFMKKTGFDYVAKTVGDSKVFHLFRTETEAMKPAIYIEIAHKNFKWLDKLKEEMKICETDLKQPLVLFNRGEAQCGIVGLVNCLKRESGGENMRCVFIMDKDTDSKLSINGAKTLQQTNKNLLMNIYKGGEWGSMRHINISKAAQLRVEHAYINTLTRGDLSSLRWIEGPLSFYRPENHNDRVFCTVYYAALNFRDIMLATGKLSPDALPGDLAGQDCVLGVEFSGRNSNDERVMGMISARGLSTTLLADPLFMWPVPPSWTLEQAATVPSVYATCYYSLIVRGGMRKGESVLIHAGTGGVGQAAITIALSMGCDVFTTVGSQQKREFLLNAFPQLNEKHIGNSRDTSFEQMVLRQTNGRGVDLVLNSLSEDKLQASVRCLANDGRFLEIGKLDLSNNTALGMSVFLKNTTFHGILLGTLFVTGSKSREKMEVVRLVKEGIASGVVKPLPATTFTSGQIEQAFRYMATGKHIGKVLIQMRAEEKEELVNPKVLQVAAVPKSYMNPDKSYIITGGLGGFGLQLCDWLMYRGARHIVLVSRSGVTTGYQLLCLRRWANRGIKVVVSTVDATSLNGAKKLIGEASRLAPVGGIFNLSAILKDNPIQEQTEADFVAVCKSKVDTTRCLDEASRADCNQLDYFVAFSSIVSGRGNMGQSNYGLANSQLERICDERQRLGFPAVAIQWGAIGDVGLVMTLFGDNNEAVIGGTLPQRMSSCLQTLDYFLQVPHSVVASAVVAEKRKTLKTKELSLVNTITNILGIKDTKMVNPHSTLVDLGLDSLMGTEIKQTLERNFDIVLSGAEIRALTLAKIDKLSLSTSQKEYVEVEKKPADTAEQVLVESLVPKDTLVRMSPGDGKANHSLFMVHPIEGTVSCFSPIVSRLPDKCTVFGLQATPQVPLTSVPAMASYYIKEMKSVQGKGPYTVCGYSYGACIAFEMCLQLERGGDVTRLVLLDGSPVFVLTAIFRQQERLKNITDYDTDHCIALAHFLSLMGHTEVKVQVQEELLRVKAEDRYKIVSQKLKGKSPFSDNEIQEAAKSYYSKLYAAQSYSPSVHYKRDVTLVKAADNVVEDSPDYELNKHCDKKVTVVTLPGGHTSIMKGDGASKIASILTDVMMKM